MKIVTTTMLYVLIMKKFPNRLQLSALVILLVASTIHRYPIYLHHIFVCLFIPPTNKVVSEYYNQFHLTMQTMTCCHLGHWCSFTLYLTLYIYSYGTVVTQSSESDDGSNMRLRVSAYGVSLLIFSISLTSFAAVYTEKTLKKDMTASS